MRLVLIRHAASHHSAQGIIADIAGCTGLTEGGWAQARALADRLRATGEVSDCHTLLCSPVPRARQTADVLAAALPVTAVEIDDDLREVHPGEADGLSWEAVPRQVWSVRSSKGARSPLRPWGRKLVCVHRTSAHDASAAGRALPRADSRRRLARGFYRGLPLPALRDPLVEAAVLPGANAYCPDRMADVRHAMDARALQ